MKTLISAITLMFAFGGAQALATGPKNPKGDACEKPLTSPIQLADSIEAKLVGDLKNSWFTEFKKGSVIRITRPHQRQGYGSRNSYSVLDRFQDELKEIPGLTIKESWYGFHQREVNEICITVTGNFASLLNALNSVSGQFSLDTPPYRYDLEETETYIYDKLGWDNVRKIHFDGSEFKVQLKGSQSDYKNKILNDSWSVGGRYIKATYTYEKLDATPVAELSKEQITMLMGALKGVVINEVRLKDDKVLLHITITDLENFDPEKKPSTIVHEGKTYTVELVLVGATG